MAKTKSNYFLNCFEFGGAVALVTDAIRGYSKAVFGEGDTPACQDDHPERPLGGFQMPVPREGHENVRDHEQQDGQQLSACHIDNFCILLAIRYGRPPPAALLLRVSPA